MRVHVRETARVRNSELGRSRFLASRRDVTVGGQTLIADEFTGHGTDEEHFLGDFLLRIQAEVNENLRVVVGHRLRFLVQDRRVETVEFDVGVLLQEVQDGLCLVL